MFDKHFMSLWGTLRRNGKLKLLGYPRDEEGGRLLINQYIRAKHLYTRLTLYNGDRTREIEHVDL